MCFASSRWTARLNSSAQACWYPPEGKRSCNIDFYYGNRHYQSYKDKDFCEKKDSVTISSAKITTTCYFNEKLAHHPTTTRSIPPWTPTPVPDPIKLGPNPKVLIVGDSITHGQEGDFTWRYRISEWFKNYAPDTKPDFVGYVDGSRHQHGILLTLADLIPARKNATSLESPSRRC